METKRVVPLNKKENNGIIVTGGISTQNEKGAPRCKPEEKDEK